MCLDVGLTALSPEVMRSEPGWHKSQAVGIPWERKEESGGGRVRPQPHAIWLPMAHFRSTLPYLVSLSGWSSGLLTVWLPGWVLCHQLSPPPTSMSLHVHPSTTLSLFCSHPCGRGPLLQPCRAALDLCKSGGSPSFPISRVLAQDRVHKRAG